MGKGEFGNGIRARKVIEHTPGLLTLFSDGSFLRLTDLDRPACTDFRDGVASRDVVIDPSLGIWARIFLPLSATLDACKSPVVLHFHGGGFCVGTPSSPHVHNYCSHMARLTSCVWISVDYRLAPEHPLPAAYDDAYTALVWLRTQAEMSTMCKDGGADPWLRQYADFSSCFLTGDSSGGTIVHFLAAQASGKDWKPLSIKGGLLIHPAFPQDAPKSADELTQSRVRFYHTSSLPPGAPFGHPLMNPLHPDSPIKLSDLALPPMLVAVAERDPLRHGDVAYFQALCESGHGVQLFESFGVGHCFHTSIERSDADAVEKLEGAMIDFMKKLC